MAAACPSRRLSRRGLLGGAASAAVGSILGRPLHAQTWSSPVESMFEMRRKNTVVQEYDLSCGAAALATVLRYQHGDNVSEKELVRALISRDIYIENPELVQVREGFSLLDLKRVAEARGYVGIGYGNLTLEEALTIAPVITPISPADYNHFVVLIGQVGNSVQVVDPAFGNTTMSARRFQREWIDFPNIGHVGFVVARSDDPDPPGDLVPDPRVFTTPPPGYIRNSLF